MFTVIGCMVTGILIGYATRRIKLSFIPSVITGMIWILLFLLGWEVGHNQQIIAALPTLGGTALLLALSALLGSCLAAWILWKRSRPNQSTHIQQPAINVGQKGTNCKDTLTRHKGAHKNQSIKEKG